MKTEKLQAEATRQQKLFATILAEGYTPVDENHPLNDLVGTVQTLDLYLEKFTDKVLCKLYLKGQRGDEQAYHFIPLWQIIKYNGQDIIHNQGVVLQPGTEFRMDVVVGVRRIMDNQKWVPALRLPQN